MTRHNNTVVITDILSIAVAYLCVIVVKHFLNDSHGETNAGNVSVLVRFNTEVYGVIIVQQHSSM